jgi:hypothetical protein
LIPRSPEPSGGPRPAPDRSIARSIARPVDQRVGDVERSAVCEELSRQYAAGRLSDDELEHRVGAAMQARTRGDLHPLLVDLPADAPTKAPTTPVAQRQIAPIWPALDVFAVIALIGTLAVAGLGALGVTASGSAAIIWACVLTAVTAGIGGMALTQVLHRMHRSMVERAERQLRAEHRLSGPA